MHEQQSLRRIAEYCVGPPLVAHENSKVLVPGGNHKLFDNQIVHGQLRIICALPRTMFLSLGAPDNHMMNFVGPICEA